MSGTGPAPDADVTAALRTLGKRRLVLAIHDASFPGDPGSDPGRGTPYSRAAHRFLEFARGLGFDAIMLGPQGLPSRDNSSPYDSTLFSRNVLNIDMETLVDDPLWADAARDAGLAVRPAAQALDRARHQAAWDRCQRELDALHAALLAARTRGDGRVLPLERALAAFREEHPGWLEDDGLYFALAARHGHRHYRDWPSARDRDLLDRTRPSGEAATARRAEALRALAAPVERHALAQLAVHRQHAAFRERLRRLGLRLYADLQVGVSPCDAWQHGHLYLEGYLLGAPASRTNPDGQPWGYRVFDPDRYREPDGGPGPVARFVARRIAKLLDESDGIRIDHPHGLVCPWVYRADDPDPFHAVRTGARVFASPALPDHPALARHAIVRREQLAPDQAVARHADAWVRELDAEQVERYGFLFNVVASAVEARGGGLDDLVCEVLSTCPFPLKRVMARHGLGRFRVTQKADVHDERDVYRGENAKPEDWIMVGNHDTPPILKLAREWSGMAAGRDRAAYLARRLRPEGDAEALAAELAAEPVRMVEAQFADAFARAASHVLIFFPDLLGMDDVYNRPGTVGADNWSLRVPPDYAMRYARDRARGTAVDLRRVLALALRARGSAFVSSHQGLVDRLAQGRG